MSLVKLVLLVALALVAAPLVWLAATLLPLVDLAPLRGSR